ncbi:uncharacterized protein LOC110269029 isoform X2 [Arachis ipaensis]|uniref:uncharacterized protein LOC110269029 isoform X2 n=1 Tax=Arachis ipaensis TaxID=130454 RepID=UPI000A2B52AB|nr:uncharacterized protein LOC110269029 isoform X2 [Arachis ipaensis]
MARNGGVTYKQITCSFIIIGFVICAIIVESHDSIPKWSSAQYDGLQHPEYKLKRCAQSCKSRYRNNPEAAEDCIRRCNAKYVPPVESYNNGM